eukprot:1890541-Ditylum_brightwellii.AAC.1
MVDLKQTASWRKKRQKPITSAVTIEEEQRKRNQEEKASKRKTVPGEAVANSTTPTKQSQMTVTIYSKDNSANKTVAERMKERGEGYVDNRSKIKTPVEASGY